MRETRETRGMREMREMREAREMREMREMRQRERESTVLLLIKNSNPSANNSLIAVSPSG